MTLGILDWGIGGLYAMRRALERQPSLDVVYLSDTGQTPYGKQPQAQLEHTVDQALKRLRRHGADRLLVACHSASTVAPQHGVIRPHLVPPGRSLVLGGRRTIESGLWPGDIHRVAQPLSALIEAGQHHSRVALETLDRLLEGVGPVDVVVLACTHYRAMAPAIEERVGAPTFDPALAWVDTLDLPSGQANHRFLTTGDPAGLAAGVRGILGRAAAVHRCG